MAIQPIGLNGYMPGLNVQKPTPAEAAESFSAFLSDALNQVNQTQIESSKLNEKYITGQIQDVHQVMVAGQKSTIMLQLTMQIRNKVIEAYQEIMRIPM